MRERKRPSSTLAPVAAGLFLSALLLPAADQSVLLQPVASVSAPSGAALLRFDVSAIPPGLVVVSARLRVSTGDAETRLAVYDLERDIAVGKPWSGPAPRRYLDYEVAPFSFRSRLFPVGGVAETDVLPLLKTVLATRRKALSFAVLSETPGPPPTAKAAQLRIVLSTTAPRAVSNYPLTDDKFGPVTLDASESAKPDGSKAGLAYRWWVAAPAPGSSNSPGQELGSEVKIKFEPDVPGLWTVRLRVTDTASKEFSDTDAVFTCAQLGPHPRLGLNPALLNPVRVLRSTKKPQWERFQTWLNAPRDPAYGTKAQALLYGYVVSKNRAYFDQAWTLYADRLYVNGNDRAQGLRPFFGECGKAVYCQDREAAVSGGFLMFEIACLYDWGFDALNPTQHADVVEWLNLAADDSYRRNPYLHAHFGGEGSAILLGLCASAYATYGENHPASQQREWFRTEWAHTLRALDVVGRGGATGAPDQYGQITASALINMANIVFFASAENLFVTHPWFQRRLAFEAFSNSTRRADGLALARRFPGTEEADLWNAQFRQPASEEASDAWTNLYFYSPAPALVKPKRLSFFDPSMGIVFLRSSWEPAEVSRLQFHAGPRVSDHQAMDEGSLSFDGKPDPPPPGQNGKAPELIDFEDYFAHPEHFDLAKVPVFTDNGIAAVWPSDLSRAYSNDSSRKVFRRLVYLREPDTLLVADTVNGASTVRAEGKTAPTLIPFENTDTFGASVTANGKTYKVTFAKAVAAAPQVEGFDLQAPVITNVKPGAVLPAGTSLTTLSLTTSEPAQCRFAYKANTMFPYMNGSFLSGDGLNHTVQSGTLDNGDTYTYYIRCQDKAGNENLEDTRLRFSVSR